MNDLTKEHHILSLHEHHFYYRIDLFSLYLLLQINIGTSLLSLQDKKIFIGILFIVGAFHNS